jgi:predicted ATPase
MSNMVDLDLQPEMVGREKELNELQKYLASAAEGQGNTIFIAGEAGIGKTRLVNELNRIAQAKGFQTFYGNSMFESLTPYMPFIETLRSGGLESLFAEVTPRVEIVYLVTHSGLLVKDVVRSETQLNPDIFAAMLTTVSNFIKESLSILTGNEKEGALNTLGYENYKILIESGKNVNLAVIISGKENEFLINDMKEISMRANKNYGSILENWDGDDSGLEGIESLLEPLISSGKYDGIDYAKDDPKIKRNMLFENILLGIIRHARANPSMFCIEDLQWADPSTLALMHYVARNTCNCNLLMLGTYRPEDIIETTGEKVHHLVETMQLMNREDIFRKIELNRLGEDNMDEMLKTLLGNTSFTDEFKSEIYKETEGNPLFIVSLVRMLEEENTIAQKDGKWILVKDLIDANMPSKMHDVIERRLNRVSDDERKTLDYASVIGGEFTSNILSEVLSLQRVQLLEQLRTLEQSHKLIQFSETNYKFDHAKIKEVLYRKIPTELRMEYHALVAAAIENLNKDDLEKVVDDLAFHYNNCQNKEKALAYLIKAADKATNQSAPLEALRNYLDALKIVEAMEDSIENRKTKLKLLMALGDNCLNRGDWDDALSYFHRAIKVSDDVEDEKSKAEGYKNIGLIHRHRNEWEDAKSFFNKGLEISEKFKDYHNTASIYYWLGALSDEKGELSEAKNYYGKCMELAVNIGDSSEIADAYLGLGRLHVRKGEYDESTENFKKAVDILEKTQDLGELSKAYVNLGASYNKMNKVDESIICYRKAIEIADKTRNVRIKGYTLLNSAHSFIKKNDFFTAINYLDTALEIFNKLGERLAIAISYENYGTISSSRREWDKATDYFERAIKICKELDTPYNLGEIHIAYGLMYKDKGENAKANEQLTKALEIFTELQNKQKVEKVQKELSSL